MPAGRLRRWCASALVAAAILTAVPAHADGGAWLWFEYRVPAWRRPPQAPRLTVRLWSDTRLFAAPGTVTQQFLRVGPVFDATSWLTLALHGVVYLDLRPAGHYQAEARFEVEPTFNFRIWRFLFNDRNRYEYRWRETGDRHRYRNQLRVTYAPKGARLLPFIWDEVLVDFADGPNENRLAGGLGVMLNSHVRVEAGYLWRTRRAQPEWTHDHVALFYIFVNAPPAR